PARGGGFESDARDRGARDPPRRPPEGGARVTDPPACSRRELLGLGAAALVLAGGLPLAACSGGDALERALAGFYRDRAAARAVGSEVLALEPKLGPGDWTARVVRDRAGELGALARGDPQRLAATLRAQDREDFARGRVVVVRGWVLSETESALLALA